MQKRKKTELPDDVWFVVKLRDLEHGLTSTMGTSSKSDVVEITLDRKYVASNRRQSANRIRSELRRLGPVLLAKWDL